MWCKQDGYVIIPAFNEEPVIRTTVEPLITDGYRVIVVDDCSTDNTWNILRNMPVIAIRHPVNLGQGAALETGMEYARQHNAEFAVHFDADGQHDRNDIPGMLNILANDEADIVIGSRFLNPSTIAAVPKFKRLLLKGGIVISGLSSGLWLTDTHNGFRALSSRALHTLRLTENGFSHATEILSEIRRSGLRYAEYPTHITYTDYSRMKGQSSWNAINIVVDLIIKRVLS